MVYEEKTKILRSTGVSCTTTEELLGEEGGEREGLRKVMTGRILTVKVCMRAS